MKIEHRCPNCKTVDYVMYKCDTCGVQKWAPEITIIKDFVEYHFCDYKCVLRFIILELKKEAPADDRFTYGNEDKTNENID